MGALAPFLMLQNRLNRKISCAAAVKKAAIGHELVHRNQLGQVLHVGEIGIAARVAGDAQEVHGSEDAVDADERQ